MRHCKAYNDPPAVADKIKKQGIYTIYESNTFNAVLAVGGESDKVVQYLIDESEPNTPKAKRRNIKDDGTWSDWTAYSFT